MTAKASRNGLPPSYFVLDHNATVKKRAGIHVTLITSKTGTHESTTINTILQSDQKIRNSMKKTTNFIERKNGEKATGLDGNEGFSGWETNLKTRLESESKEACLPPI
jgi:hypothetical protein